MGRCVALALLLLALGMCPMCDGMVALRGISCHSHSLQHGGG
jgi:hypothetical protein